MRKCFFTIFFIACLSTFINAEACTGMKLTAKDGTFVTGRTLEFGIQVDVSVAVVPRNYKFKGTTPNGEGLSYTSKYAAVGAMAFGNPCLMDGLNEKGLAAGTFYFPGFAEYAVINSENQSKALSPAEFTNWILTQFATVGEVKESLKNVVIAPTVIKDWGTSTPPFHYVVYDKEGNCLVIEPIKGQLLTYDNPLGTFTNSPYFEWHMTNLRNYINLTPFNVKPITLNGVALAPFGEGSGMVGMPGDFTPPSRFVRAAIFSAVATPSETAHESVFQLFHILNQFDIPVGAARAKEGNVIYTDSTQITCVRDPQALKFYFRTYNDQAIKSVDLQQFDLNAKAMKSLNLKGASKALDISSQLSS